MGDPLDKDDFGWRPVSGAIDMEVKSIGGVTGKCYVGRQC